MSILAKINSAIAAIGRQIKLVKTNYPPIGTVLSFAGTTIPDGYLLCDGQAVSRTDYAKLFAVIGTTYGTDDGSTTFNLPNLIDRFVQGSATAGTVKAAGLPNITGTMGKLKCVANPTSANANSYASGCFTHTKVGSANCYTGAGYSQTDVSIDASRSNSIYGKSTTVQPPALTMKMIIKY